MNDGILEPRKTALYDTHVASGGKMVPFAGFMMPIQYEGVIAEHMAVRTRAGLFDVSHMGEFTLEGSDAAAFLDYLLPNRYADLQDMHCRYSPMLNERGGTVDDLIVYRYDEAKYLIIVNASNIDKDFAWIQSKLRGDVRLQNISDTLAEIAIQGPRADDIMRKITDGELPAKNYTFVPSVNVAGVECVVSRTGYTGEDGFEVYCANENAARLWNAMIEAGAEHGLVPCGLGARDTLRLEAAMPLYGHELSDDITPIEASLGSFVKLDKDTLGSAFIGRDALAANPATRRRIGLRVTGKGIAREHCDVYKDGVKVGVTTSGTMMPFVKYAGAMALVEASTSRVGGTFEIDVRGRMIEAEQVRLPFYKRVR